MHHSTNQTIEQKFVVYQEMVSKLKKEVAVAKYDARKIRGHYKASRVNQRDKRLKQQIQKLKTDICVLKQKDSSNIISHAKSKRQKRDIKNYYMHKAETVRQVYEDMVTECEDNAMDKDIYIRVIENELQNLIAKKEVVGDVQLEKLVYGFKLRLCVYQCLIRNLSTQQYGGLIDDILRTYTDVGLVRIPPHQAVENMARGPGVFSDIQSAERILMDDKLCIHWDSTKKGDKDINVISVSTSQASILLAVSEIATSSSDEYAQDIRHFQRHCSQLLSV